MEQVKTAGYLLVVLVQLEVARRKLFEAQFGKVAER